MFEEGAVIFWGMDPNEIEDVVQNLLKFGTDIVAEMLVNEETDINTFE